MISHRFLAAVLAISTVALPAATSFADLIVTVTPNSTPGHTLWTFSGSTTYVQQAAGGKFAAGAPSLIEEWKGGSPESDYVVTGAYNNHIASLQSGGINLKVTSAGTPSFGSIDSLHIDHDTTGDDFGVGLLGTVDIPLVQGDLVEWTGSGVFDVDFTKLNLGSFSFVSYGGSTLGGGITGQMLLTLNVNSSSVPEIDPGSLSAALALVMGALALKEQRRAVAR